MVQMKCYGKRNETMNKTELIAEVSKKTGMSKKDAERAVNAAVGRRA